MLGWRVDYSLGYRGRNHLHPYHLLYWQRLRQPREMSTSKSLNVVCKLSLLIASLIIRARGHPIALLMTLEYQLANPDSFPYVWLPSYILAAEGLECQCVRENRFIREDFRKSRGLDCIDESMSDQ